MSAPAKLTKSAGDHGAPSGEVPLADIETAAARRTLAFDGRGADAALADLVVLDRQVRTSAAHPTQTSGSQTS